MSTVKNITRPLVSVIIPSYNHSDYLSEAIESVIQQTYPSVEVVVVDDGSTDSTAAVAGSYPQVHYVYQDNQGLSAARNTGVGLSKGELLVFLDADDWLYPQGIEINVQYMLQHEEAAFVSGAYDNIFIEEKKIKEEVKEVKSDHYRHLLNSNYIGMIAAVMFRSWVFDEYRYDVSLRACEDFDLYLKISRKYPVVHHTAKIAGYRIHASNMSSNIPLMLYAVMQVMKRQRKNLRTPAEKQAYQRGIILWRDYYCTLLYRNMVLNKITGNTAITLLIFSPYLGVKGLLHQRLNGIISSMADIIKMVFKKLI